MHTFSASQLMSGFHTGGGGMGNGGYPPKQHISLPHQGMRLQYMYQNILHVIIMKQKNDGIKGINVINTDFDQNGIWEVLNVKNFLGSMPPDPLEMVEFYHKIDSCSPPNNPVWKVYARYTKHNLIIITSWSTRMYLMWRMHKGFI